MEERDLAGIAGQLYALPISDFVTARTAAAKDVAGTDPATEGQRSLAEEVRALPKPSVAAWAVNMLAAHRPETLQELAGLGASMRAAQSSLDAAALRSLGQERRQLLSSAVKTAREVTEQHGRKISGVIATEVEQTLRAATADEGAAGAVQSGRLLRALSADGVDVVDLAGAVAAPGVAGAAASGKRPADQPRLQAVRQVPRTPTPSALARARAGLQAAEEAARAASDDALRCEEELATATAETARLADEVRALREQLARTEEDLKSARKRREATTARAQQAARTAVRERRKEVLARERVLRLGNTPE
ncbi:MAG: hypothetical protein JWO29_1420 [Arthrobacter sp.]|nr:hypothetical protein [Arthrobacter sp.]